MPLDFLYFTEYTWEDSFSQYNDLEAYTFEKDTSFVHPRFTKYIINLKFKHCNTYKKSFY